MNNRNDTSNAAEENGVAEHESKTTDQLLNELESIKGLLDEQDWPRSVSETEIDIPILEDVVTDNSDGENADLQPLLNLNAIFDEELKDNTLEPIESDPIKADALEFTQANLSSTTPPKDPVEDLLFDKLLDPEDSGIQQLDELTSEFLDTLGLEENFELDASFDQYTQSEQESAADAISYNSLEQQLDNYIESGKSLDTRHPDYEEQQQEFVLSEQNVFDSSPDSSLQQKDLDISVLVDDIIEEFIPVIEDELRNRLAQLSPDMIQRLASKHKA